MLRGKGDFADVLKIEMQRVSWIIWVDSVKSQESLNMEGSGRRESQGDMMWKTLHVPFLALKMVEEAMNKGKQL